MAGEARIPGGLQINKRVSNVVVIDKRPAFNTFKADVDGVKGPTPGAITALTSGTDVDLSQLTEPGWAEFLNMSDTITVEWGVWDSVRHSFYPIGKLAPGQGAVHQFSENFGERDDGPGTGTTASSIVKLRFYGEGGSAVVYVGAWER